MKKSNPPPENSHKYKLSTPGAGKGDMRGAKITVLSEQGRDNWDRIFQKKTQAKEGL